MARIFSEEFTRQFKRQLVHFLVVGLGGALFILLVVILLNVFLPR